LILKVSKVLQVKIKAYKVKSQKILSLNNLTETLWLLIQNKTFLVTLDQHKDLKVAEDHQLGQKVQVEE